MKFQTLSLVAGTMTCNASCNFCVASLTHNADVGHKLDPINYRNLKKTINLAEITGVTTVILTSKGEPLLFPDQVTQYMEYLNQHSNIPLIELQTNGSIIEMDEYKGVETANLLYKWYTYGMTTVMLSNVGPNEELSRKIYFPKRKDPINYQKMVDKIHNAKLNVRLTTVGIKGGVCGIESFKEYIAWAKFLGVEQITWRPVAKTSDENAEDKSTLNWIKENGLNQDQVSEIHNHVAKTGTLIQKLVHGGAVYDYEGQNVCLTNCLTRDPNEETQRQLIFFASGDLYSDWELKGSKIL